MYSLPLASRKWFSILLALGSTGVLLIIVIGMVSVFLSEMRLSRLQYDAILGSAQAEWAFEYAMLKVRNHRDGFADRMLPTSPDARIFSWASARTDKVQVSYSIDAQSMRWSFSGWGGNYTIIPLFVGRCQDRIDSASASCDPRTFLSIDPVREIKHLTTDRDAADLSWSIVAQSGSENVSISGTGIIDGNGTEIATMRQEGILCYNNLGNIKPSTIALTPSGGCPVGFDESSWGASIPYFYDLKGSTKDFLQNTGDFSGMTISDPYILIYSSWSSSTITLETDSPFTLPVRTITAEARKGDSLQSLQFTEDNSRYYDALKYGIYNTP